MVEIARQSHNWGYALWQQEIKNKGDLILFLFFKKMYQREAAQAVRRGKGGVGVGEGRREEGMPMSPPLS
jgi:hypothetical protein